MKLKIFFLKIRKKGLAHYLKRLFKSIAVVLIPQYDRSFVFELILSDYSVGKKKDDVKVRIIQKVDDLTTFIQKREDWYLNHVKKMFENRNLCFIAEIDNQIVSCLWTCFNEFYLPEVNYTIKVDKNVVPLVDAYTVKQYRGLGVYETVWNSCLQYLKEQTEFDRVYGSVAASNRRSLLVHKKLQLENVVMVITYIRILGINIHFIKDAKKVKNKR